MVVGTEPLQHNFSRGGVGVAGRSERSKSWSSAVAKTILVGPDIEKGAKILQILDDAGLRVSVALWAFLPDYEDWRLILSGRKFDAAGLKGGMNSSTAHWMPLGSRWKRPRRLASSVVAILSSDPCGSSERPKAPMACAWVVEPSAIASSKTLTRTASLNH